VQGQVRPPQSAAQMQGIKMLRRRGYAPMQASRRPRAPSPGARRRGRRKLDRKDGARITVRKREEARTRAHSTKPRVSRRARGKTKEHARGRSSKMKTSE
jgi:hypothetical protein